MFLIAATTIKNHRKLNEHDTKYVQKLEDIYNLFHQLSFFSCQHDLFHVGISLKYFVLRFDVS